MGSLCPRAPWRHSRRGGWLSVCIGHGGQHGHVSSALLKISVPAGNPFAPASRAHGPMAAGCGWMAFRPHQTRWAARACFFCPAEDKRPSMGSLCPRTPPPWPPGRLAFRQLADAQQAALVNAGPGGYAARLRRPFNQYGCLRYVHDLPMPIGFLQRHIVDAAVKGGQGCALGER